MAEKKEIKEALVTEEGIKGNPHLRMVIKDVYGAFKPGHPASQAEVTGMIGCRRNYWLFKIGEDGAPAPQPKLFAKAGSWVSIQEKNIIDQMMAEPKVKAAHESFWKQMQDQGIPVEVEPPQLEGVRILDQIK